MTNWKPDYEDTVEETTEDIGPMEDLGDNEDEGVHVVEDVETNDISEDDTFEEEFEKLLLEEEGQDMEINGEVEIKEEVKKVETKPVLKKSKHRNMKSSKVDFSRSTGGSRLSKLIGRDNDIQL